MRLADLDFELPPELIAQTPLEPRDAARLLVLSRATGSVAHHTFRDLLQLLRPGDLLVVNDSRVLPARLRAVRPETGGRCEVLLLRETAPDTWEALLRPSRRLRPGTRLDFGEVTAVCGEHLADGCRQVTFEPPGRLRDLLPQLGVMPLPPYIHSRLDEPERYQTVYSRELGSAAAPTAGLHFTPELLAALHDRGVAQAAVTLHVGLDTFRPVQTPLVEDHPIHSEAWCVPAAAAAQVAATKAAGGRVVAVGTTAVRALETAAQSGQVVAGAGWTRLFITPGYQFRAVDALLTNFHLPRTTLIALVSAFAGSAAIRAAYQDAFAQRYRLLSFGDAMLIA
ncbi:MAG: tRNA preQ1(34) S-adenosylmethionine ribosyltransferase-isomerase QueA [Fimbriimonadaceae bacterium]|nr:tRNA preQ1(34) S-adenosylmethionine ribosyltransferase-isomerase QueA [Fimbriimonadaceae bacterium]